MDETLMKVRILARAEVTLARVHGRVLARRLMLTTLAVGALLLTVVMLNLGAYALLDEHYGRGPAAFIVAAANAVIAVMLLFVAGRVQTGPEEAMIQEIRDMALTELSTDAEVVKDGLTSVMSDVEKIRSSVGALTGGAAASLGSLSPLLHLLIDALKSRKG